MHRQLSDVVLAARGLRKRFGARQALADVSLSAARGDVVALLGENGAGKTTTLRIVTGFLEADAGEVEIGGRRVDADHGRADVGYLCEGAPLPAELRVDEYLGFRAALKGVPRRTRAARVAEVSAQVGLDGATRHRIIGQLSRGYRQRVGLADALLAAPALLVLDEPTDGLDPNQRRELLAVVRAVAERAAVLFATHILSEAAAVATHVVVLDAGRVVASGTRAQLLERAPGLYVRLRCAAEAVAPTLARLTAIAGVQATARGGGADVLELDVVLERDSEELRAQVAAVVSAAGQLLELSPARSSLDDVFAALTRRQAPP